MNEYRARTTGQICTEQQFRDAFPNQAFPTVLDKLTLEMHGYDAVLAAPAPPTSISQVAVRDGVVMDPLGNWVHGWRVDELPADVVAANAAAAAQAARDTAKAARTASVATITVDVDGMSFDGDEISQGRMARAILAMETAGVPTTPWTLSNNTMTNVTNVQLRNALVKAGLAQTAMWALP